MPTGEFRRDPSAPRACDGRAPHRPRSQTNRPDLPTPATEIIEFAPHIVTKHNWVNRAFMLTGLTLALFLCTGLGYLIRLHAAT